MRALGDWWKETGNAEAPRARWFGIFPREVRFRERVPSRLTVPSVKVALGEYLTIPNEESVSAPHPLTTEWPLVTAVNLIAPGQMPLEGQSGSVALAGVPLNQEPSAVLGAPMGSPSSFGPPAERSAPAETEIPLSKRLAYLLQPPTNLLLSRVGPLEWPGTLFEYQLDGIKALLSRDSLLLADDMGLGKTIQAVGALRILVLQCRVESSLLIVPAGLVSLGGHPKPAIRGHLKTGQ